MNNYFEIFNIKIDEILYVNNQHQLSVVNMIDQPRKVFDDEFDTPSKVFLFRNLWATFFFCFSRFMNFSTMVAIAISKATGTKLVEMVSGTQSIL